MQNAKDTFYVMLRDRLAGLNPARTMVLRGVTRPSSLVEENELPTAYQPVDTFSLHWVGVKVASRKTLPLVSTTCEIHFSTDGSAGNGGMDRGRLLARMAGELASALNTAPQNVVKRNFSASANGTTMGTNVFWGDVTFGGVETAGERLKHEATVEVFAYQEAGEL